MDAAETSTGQDTHPTPPCTMSTRIFRLQGENVKEPCKNVFWVIECAVLYRSFRKHWQKMDKSWNSEQETPLGGRMDCLCPKFWVRNPAHIPHKYCWCSVLCWNIQSEGRPGAWSSVTVRIQRGQGKQPLFFVLEKVRLRAGLGMKISIWPHCVDGHWLWSLHQPASQFHVYLPCSGRPI